MDKCTHCRDVRQKLIDESNGQPAVLSFLSSLSLSVHARSFSPAFAGTRGTRMKNRVASAIPTTQINRVIATARSDCLETPIVPRFTTAKLDREPVCFLLSTLFLSIRARVFLPSYDPRDCSPEERERGTRRCDAKSIHVRFLGMRVGTVAGYPR